MDTAVKVGDVTQVYVTEERATLALQGFLLTLRANSSL